MHERLLRGAKLGRYIIDEQIGEGGMGVVYSAHDPELHRRVALKLLQPDIRTAEGSARLLREAQAMAQLSHPNVIHVYDVGTFGDHVFLALELIDGEQLGRWVKHQKRSWREVVRIFSAAGRGLAAAHAAGLIHRDFKPDNVMIGKDGRVLVMDFGLARTAHDATEDDDAPLARGSRPSLPELTEVGTIMGTPGYAAPEYLAELPGDARSDQFSFAASLYACLYRKRPYEARTFAAYRTMLATGLAEPPADSDVPIWLRRVIERGLALDPAQRFPSMTAFLDALSADPAIRRRRWLIAAGVVVTLGIATAVTVRSMAMTEENRALLCNGADRKLIGVWDNARREAVRTAFLAADRPYAQTAFDGVAKRLDERASAWTAMHTDSCKATRLRGEQPESVMTLRMACLDQRLRELGQLVDVFVAADAKVVERAIGATSALTPLESCADVKELLAAIPPPANPATRSMVDELRKTLARSKALHDGGKFKEAADVAKHTVEAAKTLDYRPIEAEALMRLGETQVFLQEAQPAVDTLRQATRAAEASGYDEIRARALAWMVGVLGEQLERPREALAIAEDAKAAIERLGGDPYIESILESGLGRMYGATGEYTKQLEHNERALAIRRKIFGEDDPNTANAYNNVGVALNGLGRYHEALAIHRKAQAIRTRVLGPDHPDAAMSAANVDSQYYDLGELEDALTYADAALTAAKRSLPAKHATILSSLSNKAGLLAELGRYDEAQITYDELFATLRAELPKSGRMARALANHAALVLVPTGRAKEALAQADRALAMFLALSGKADDDVAFAMETKARALAAMNKLDAALSTFHEALEITEKVVGPDHPYLLDVLVGAGKVELAKRRPAEAAKLLERAFAICEAHKIGGKWRARIELTLARAIVTTDKARAVALATHAREWYGRSQLKTELAELDAWLAANR